MAAPTAPVRARTTATVVRRAAVALGLVARPTGAWIVADGEVTWKPAVDVNRIVLGGQVLALAAILVLGRIVLAHSRRGRSSARIVSRSSTRSPLPHIVLRLARR